MPPTADNANAISIEEIDFSKYRTKELANQVSDLLGLPRSVGKLAATIFLCVIVAVVVIYIVMKIGQHETLGILAAEVYGFPVAIIFAIALWIVLMIHKSLANLTRIVDILLETTSIIAEDYLRLASGEKKLPPMSKLVGAVYEHVFMHAFREALAGTTGFLGKPIYWAYRLTVDRMLRIVVRFIAERRATEEDKNEMEAFVVDAMQSFSEEESSTLSGLRWARRKINSSGNWLTSRILWPCYFLLALFLALLISPIVAVLIFG